MSARLVYHTAESTTGGESPFDAALSAIVADAELCLACPYLSLDYLRNLLATASSWRLLTDAKS